MGLCFGRDRSGRLPIMPDWRPETEARAKTNSLLSYEAWRQLGFTMSSLAELTELVGFFSYSRDDDEDFKGSLSALRDGIQRELRAQLGRNKTNFHLFQDQEAIAPGKQWELEIKKAVAQSVFFIPLITPRSIGSKYCQFEFESFLAREQAIGRTDLIFPILYIPVPALQNEAKWRGDPVLSIIGQRQYVDWRSVRHLEVHSPVVREKIADFCRTIVETLNETWISPEERQRIEETKARQLAEEQRLKAEAEVQQRAERERAAVERRAAEAESRRKAQAEVLRRAEEERRRQEAEAKRKAEQNEERAFAAAKEAEDVTLIDAFLASYPEGRFTNEAQISRAPLMVRDDEFKAATASNDAVILKAFLKNYARGTLTDKARAQLRSLPESVHQRRKRNLLLIGCLVLVSVGVWAISEQNTNNNNNMQLERLAEKNGFNFKNNMQVFGSKVGESPTLP